jgi:hypothetical protein
MTNVFGWLCLVLVLVSTGVAIGVLVNSWLTRQRHEALRRSAAKLQAEWQALDAAQRLYATYLQSRQTMQEAAVQEHQRPSSP